MGHRTKDIEIIKHYEPDKESMLHALMAVLALSKQEKPEKEKNLPEKEAEKLITLQR